MANSTSAKTPAYRCQVESEDILICDPKGEPRVIIPYFPPATRNSDMFHGRLRKQEARALARKIAKALNSGLADAVDAFPVRA